MSALSREQQVSFFKDTNIATDQADMQLFSYDFERALQFELGRKFYALIKPAQAIIARLIDKGCVGYENRVGANGVDTYLWVESTDADRLVMGLENQNLTVLVYLVTKYNETHLHIRRIWNDFDTLKASGHYMLGVDAWEQLDKPTYRNAILAAETAANEYSDDIRDQNGKPLTRFVSRPSLLTHRDEDNAGMKYLDGRDEGYVASVNIDVLTKSPCCDSPTLTIKNSGEYIYTSLAAVLALPCFEDEDSEE